MFIIGKLALVNQRFSPGLRQVIDNLIWLSTDKLLQMGLSLVVGVWVARYLGPTQFGTLNYAITFVSLFSAIADLGLGMLVVRDVARDPSCKNEILGTAFALKLVGGVLTLLLAVGAISLFNTHDSLTRWLVGIIAAGTIFQAFDVINFWFQSQIQSKYTVIAKNSAYVLICIARIALIQIQAPLIAFAWIRLAETAVGALGLVIVYQIRGLGIKAWRTSLSQAKKLLKESWPIVLSGLAIYIYSKIDQVMLGSMLEDKSELGFYSVAVKFAEIFDFLPIILASSIFPKIAELKNKADEKYNEKFQVYFDTMAILWLSVALPVSLLSSFIVNTFYGKSYAASAAILSIYVWAQFGTNFGVARSSFLAIEGKLRFSLYFSVIGACLNVLLNLILIPRFGAFGATAATLVTYFVTIVLLNFLFKEVRFVGIMIVRSLNLYQATLRISKSIR